MEQMNEIYQPALQKGSWMNSVDCIVIGAGMAGLTYAVLAAGQGQKVFLAEQHYLPGGLFTAYRSGQFLFNVAMEWTTDCGPAGEFTRLLRRLDVDKQCRFRDIEIFKTIYSAELSRPLNIFCSEQALREELAAMFPQEASNIDRFLRDCLDGDPQRRAALNYRAARPVEVFLAEYFADPVLRQSLFSLIGCPGAMGILLIGMINAICSGEIYVPENYDHRTLPLLLSRKLKQYGADVRYRASVAAVLVEGSRAVGVRMETGELIYAPRVIAAIDGEELYSRLLPRSLAREQQLSSARTSSCVGLSTFCLFLGLNSTLPNAADNMALLSPSAGWLQDPARVDTIPLRVECQSNRHPRVAPPGKSTLCVWVPASISAFNYWGQGFEREIDDLNQVQYDEAKKRAADIVLARMEKFFPGIRSQIETMDTASPFTFKRYTRNSQGSISGRSLSTARYLKALPNQTSVEGLYHLGHWTVQSGVSTVMAAAANAFDAFSFQHTTCHS